MTDRSGRTGAPPMGALSFLLLRKRSRRSTPRPPGETDIEQQIALVISRVLRFGVLISAAVVITGGGLYLARYGASIPFYQVFSGEPSELRSVGGILEAARALSSRGIIQLGLLILIATPVARVALALVSFHLIGDRLYVIVASIVLATLFFSLVSPTV